MRDPESRQQCHKCKKFFHISDGGFLEELDDEGGLVFVCENCEPNVAPREPTDDFRASSGEVVRRADLNRAASIPGRFAHPMLGVEPTQGVVLATTAIAGDQAALDEFHERVGLAIPGVTEYGEGDAVRLAVENITDAFGGCSEERNPHQGQSRAVFLTRNECGCGRTSIDAAELVAWILSPDGGAALARRGVAVPPPALAGALTPDEAVDAARRVGVDLTCGECAALFFTGHPSSLSGAPTHALLCKTEHLPRRVLAVSCTCGTWQVEASATPPACPRCRAGERWPTQATDYVARPWEEIDARRRMYGVFHAEGESADPVAIFRSEEAASGWLTWQKSLGDEAQVGSVDYTIMPVEQLDGVAWNSYEPPPGRDVDPGPQESRAPATRAARCLLDEIEGAIEARHLPCAVDRLSEAVTSLIDVVPEFEGGAELVDQIGREIVCLHEAAREACHQAGIPWRRTALQRRRDIRMTQEIRNRLGLRRLPEDGWIRRARDLDGRVVQVVEVAEILARVDHADALPAWVQGALRDGRLVVQHMPEGDQLQIRTPVSEVCSRAPDVIVQGEGGQPLPYERPWFDRVFEVAGHSSRDEGVVQGARVP